MTYNTKQGFLTGLRVALEQNGVSDMSDILTDFRQHFDDGAAAGESEAQVCEKLGDVDEIVKQYISEMKENGKLPEDGDNYRDTQTADASGFGGETYGNYGQAQYQQPGQNYQNGQYGQYGSAQGGYTQYAAPQPQKFSPDGGSIAGLICLDILVYSWALPALAGVIFGGLYGAALGVGVSGLAVFISGIVSVFANIGGFVVTGFAPLSLIFLGIMLTALGVMLVIACIGATKGFINICIAVINQHSRVFAGHNVLNKIGSRRETREGTVQ